MNRSLGILHISKMIPGNWKKDIVTIRNVLVRHYSGTKYLSYSEAASIVDIGDVISEEDLESCDDRQSNFIAEGEIIAVLNTDDYTSYISCKGKVGAVSDFMGECLKCNANSNLHAVVPTPAPSLLFRVEIQVRQRLGS